MKRACHMNCQSKIDRSYDKPSGIYCYESNICKELCVRVFPIFNCWRKEH